MWHWAYILEMHISLSWYTFGRRKRSAFVESASQPITVRHSIESNACHMIRLFNYFIMKKSVLRNFYGHHGYGLMLERSCSNPNALRGWLFMNTSTHLYNLNPNSPYGDNLVPRAICGIGGGAK